MKKNLTKLAILAAALVGVIVLSVWAARSIVESEMSAIRHNRDVKYKSPPPCPSCGSLKFPPWADYSRNDFSVKMLCVYRCEDCDHIWGPLSKEWLKANPSEEEREMLLPPEKRTIKVRE